MLIVLVIGWIILKSHSNYVFIHGKIVVFKPDHWPCGRVSALKLEGCEFKFMAESH